MIKIIAELKRMEKHLCQGEREMEACSLMVCAIELLIRHPDETARKACLEVLSTLHSMRSFQKKMARLLGRLKDGLKAGRRECLKKMGSG